ncbi:MAG TPA: c-type cytochrome [Pseudorhodoferax sp.]|nr:c-type cytochrome [Pseudorhodoferax sp.]
MTRSSPHRLLRHIAAWLACAALGAASPALQASPALAGKNGCMGCHAAATALVGPAYRGVAARYAGQAGALQTVTDNIRKGGAGRWGDIPMPPQPQLSESDARRLAAWILGGAK